jgi:hypothetical protein
LLEFHARNLHAAHGRWDQPADRTGEGRFARARLADERQGRLRRQAYADIADGLDIRSARPLETNDEVVDGQGD